MSVSDRAGRYSRFKPQKPHLMLPLVIMALLYWLSSIPGTPLPDDPQLYALFYWLTPSIQNLLHIPAYAVLAVAWRWALSAWFDLSLTPSLMAGLIATGYGIFDEWHQSFVPGRYASLTDVMFNVAGVLLGLWLAARARRHTRAASSKILPP